MKVAIVNHGVFPDVVGGMERHTFNLAKHLQLAGVHVDLLVPEPRTTTSYPFPVHHLPWPKRPLWLWSNYDFSQHVGRWLDAHKPDIAFGQGFNLWSYLRERKIPCVFHPHGLEMFGSHLRGLEPLMTCPFRALVRYHGQHSDRVISLGGAITSILVERAGIPRSKISEIPNAVEYGDFAGAESAPQSAHLLFVGRLAFNKGIDLLADALDQLREVELRLTVVGDGPLRPRLVDLVRRDSRVTHIPNSSEEELRSQYRKNEALIFTSRFEGMPTVILEAMATGKPVIATKIGAVETMIGDKTGILIEPTASGIADGIRKFLKLSNSEKRNMGLRAQEEVRNHFDWKSVTALYLTLFDELKSRSY